MATSVTPLPAFRETAGNEYQATFLSGKAGESPTSAINDWLKSTMGAPTQLLLAAGALRADTRFVMADFLSVEGAWRTPFAAERTRPRPFTSGNGKKSNLPTMTSVGTLLAASGPDFDAVELSLQSPEHHLCIVQPKPGRMATLQSSLGARLSAIRAAFRPTYSELQLPRYTVENTLSLRNALTRAGVVTAFSNSADFGAMSEGRVYLDEVLQNVTFEVNERGMRAASATVASFPPPSAPKTPVSIRINRSFLFLLLNVRTGAILFSGRYSGPSL
jgi:serpin B